MSNFSELDNKDFLLKCVFNEHLTTYIGSYLTFKEINNFSCVSKNSYKFLKNPMFMKNYYLKILKFIDFKNPKKIDYEFDMFKKLIFEPRDKIIEKLAARVSYYWDAENRTCMKCGKKAYPHQLPQIRLNNLLRKGIHICFCEKSATNTLVANEGIKLEKDLKCLENEMEYLKLKIKGKKQEIKYHKSTINLTTIKKYLNKKLNTMIHGRQKNQCKKMINKIPYENFERRNPQYYYVLQNKRINNNNNNNINNNINNNNINNNINNNNINNNINNN